MNQCFPNRLRVPTVFLITILTLIIGACGGGGGSNSAPVSVGGFTLVVGDGPLDVAEVNIDIEEVVLIGAGGQQSFDTSDMRTINLLALRNVTELILSEDVPAGTYNKIRLTVSALEIVEHNGLSEFAQLPANGKIDLNPQGPFEISPGEDLVVEIDIDLDRSVHVVSTGNSQYRFRPVVFIDVIDQSDSARLTKLSGQLASGDDTRTLCIDDDDSECLVLDFLEDALVLAEDGTLVAVEDLADGTIVCVFGHFVIGVEGGESFRVTALVEGGEDSVQRIDGTTASLLMDGAFELEVSEEPENTTINLVAGAKLLDGNGAPLTEDFAIGDEAEAWGQTSTIELAADATFPAFLVQVTPADTEESIEGTLVAVDGDQITLMTESGEVCVLNVPETTIQHILDNPDGSESELLTLAELAAMIDDEVGVEVFGIQDGECFIADVIVVET